PRRARARSLPRDGGAPIAAGIARPAGAGLYASRSRARAGRPQAFQKPAGHGDRRLARGRLDASRYQAHGRAGISAFFAWSVLQPSGITWRRTNAARSNWQSGNPASAGRAPL